MDAGGFAVVGIGAHGQGVAGVVETDRIAKQIADADIVGVVIAGLDIGLLAPNALAVAGKDIHRAGVPADSIIIFLIEIVRPA